MTAQQETNGSRRRGEAPPSIRDVFFALGLATLTIFALVEAAEYLIPIVLAVLIWFLINAIAHGLRSVPGLNLILPNWLALTFGALITVGAIYVAGQIVVSNAADLGDGLTGFPEKAAAAVATIERWIGFDIDIDVQTALSDLRVQDFLTTIAGAIGNAANITIITALYVLFLLLDQPFYDAKIRALFPDTSRRERVKELLHRIGENTRAYVWIMTVVSILVGLFTYAIADYFNVQGAGFWGFLAFALNYIPTIGSFLGVLFPAAYALVQFDSLETVLFFVALLGVVQFVMGNLLLPRMTGDRLNLSQFVVILSLTVWGAMWGASGLFLAVPIMMVLTIICAQLDSTRPLAVLLSQTGDVGPHPNEKAN